MSVARRCLAAMLEFARDRRAMGAVEFALIAPFLLVLYLGGSQLSMALTMNRKVQHVASTINDLVTQSETITKSEVEGLLNVASSIMTPYDLGPLGISVTQVVIDDKGISKVDWNYANANMPKLAKGQLFPLPAEFKQFPSSFVIVSQTKYTFTPVAGYFITGTIPMGGTSYLKARNSASVGCKDC